MNQSDINKALAFALENGDLSQQQAMDMSTPVCNTGVESANLLPKAAIVDYLRFTVHDESRLDEMKFRLSQGCPDAFQETERGRHFYSKTHRNGQISIYSDGMTEGMGLCVELSGQGCREMEAMWITGVDTATGEVVSNDWSWFFKSITADEGISITRLDVALDDHTGSLDLNQVREATQRRHYSCRSSHWDVHLSGRRSTGDKEGLTVQIGNRTSSRVVRFYDKVAEQLAKKRPVQENNWVRVELEAHDERAHLLACKLAETTDQALHMGIIAGCIREFVEFKDMREDVSANSQMCRRPVAPWWNAFLEGWEKVKLSLTPVVRTIEKARIWLDRQVSVTLAMVHAACGGYGDKLIATMLQDGQGRFKNHHRRLIDRHRQKMGYAV